MLNELARKIHKNAINHGWWEAERPFSEVVALCHSELSEALEEYRAGRANTWFRCEEAVGAGNPDITCNSGCESYDTKPCKWFNPKPEGIAVEMADCLIRILDWAAHEGLDMDSIIAMKMAYNENRPYRHGGKVC